MKESDSNTFSVESADVLRITNGLVFVDLKAANIHYPIIKKVIGLEGYDIKITKQELI